MDIEHLELDIEILGVGRGRLRKGVGSTWESKDLDVEIFNLQNENLESGVEVLVVGRPKQRRCVGSSWGSQEFGYRNLGFGHRIFGGGLRNLGCWTSKRREGRWI